MGFIDIADPADPLLADYFDLTDVDLRSRREPELGLYMAEGAKVVQRALQAGHRPRSVLVEHKRAAAAAALLSDWPKVPVLRGSAQLLQQVTGYRVHRGFLAAMHRPPLPSVAEVAGYARRLLVLEDLVDHTNVGAAFRSAAALGFDAVLVSPRCADPFYRRSIKVSMAAVLSLPWTIAHPWPEALAELGQDGFSVLALTPDPAAVDLAEVAADPPPRVAVVIGTEGSGLSAAAIAACGTPVRIPMHNGIDSLNAAAATAVACWALRP
jgi:tRNA G18 (ribose-2'-O)-methylase SpoU